MLQRCLNKLKKGSEMYFNITLRTTLHVPFECLKPSEHACHLPKYNYFKVSLDRAFIL